MAIDIPQQGPANAARQAWGFAMQAADRRQQAKINRQSSVFGAIGQTLSGLGSAGSAYASFG